MREIKFRAWHKEKRNMYNVTSLEFVNGTLPRWYKKTYALMQYTGLKDKNGKDIYEGDILDHGDYVGGFVVEWQQPNNCGCCAEVCGWNIDLDFVPNRTKVIGNIYEHPDLLTKQP